MSLSYVPGSVVSSLNVQATPWPRHHGQSHVSAEVSCGSRILRLPTLVSSAHWCRALGQPFPSIVTCFQPIDHSKGGGWAVTPLIVYYICSQKYLYVRDSEKTQSHSVAILKEASQHELFSHKRMNSANKGMSLEADSSPVKALEENAAQLIPGLQSSETLSTVASQAMSRLLTHANCEIINACGFKLLNIR